MKANFPTGQLKAHPDFLAAIPRPVLVRAIVSHATRPTEDGPIRSEHRHEGRRFVILTEACRRVTRIELA